ncbi:MAG: hypothetical protein KAH32_00940 [Chlamydiia bacterium]|nr:hypothetical protein [Chlamydiia bacterium]
MKIQKIHYSNTAVNTIISIYSLFVIALTLYGMLYKHDCMHSYTIGFIVGIIGLIFAKSSSHLQNRYISIFVGVSYFLGVAIVYSHWMTGSIFVISFKDSIVNANHSSYFSEIFYFSAIASAILLMIYGLFSTSQNEDITSSSDIILINSKCNCGICSCCKNTTDSSEDCFCCSSKCCKGLCIEFCTCQNCPCCKNMCTTLECPCCSKKCCKGDCKNKDCNSSETLNFKEDCKNDDYKDSDCHSSETRNCCKDSSTDESKCCSNQENPQAPINSCQNNNSDNEYNTNQINNVNIPPKDCNSCTIKRGEDMFREQDNEL